MTKKEHARILNAYLSRLTNKDLEAIFKADNDCWHAQLNYGNSGQLQAQSRFYEAVSQAVDNITDYDLTLIEQITEKVSA